MDRPGVGWRARAPPFSALSAMCYGFEVGYGAATPGAKWRKTPEVLVKRAQVKLESPGGDFDDNPVRRARNNSQTRAGRDHVQRCRRLYGNNGPRRAAGDARLGGPSRTSALAVAGIQRPDAGRNWRRHAV